MEVRLSLNQERKDARIERTFSLNQERKDVKIDRILLILVSFLSWFRQERQKTIYRPDPANPSILPFLVQNKF